MDYGFGEIIKRPSSAKVLGAINTSVTLGPQVSPKTPFVGYDETSGICWHTLDDTVCRPTGDYDINARDWGFEFKNIQNATGPPGADVVPEHPNQNISYPVPVTYAQLYTNPPPGSGIWQVGIISMKFIEPSQPGICWFQWPNYLGGMACERAPGGNELDGPWRGEIGSIRLIGNVALQVW